MSYSRRTFLKSALVGAGALTAAAPGLSNYANVFAKTSGEFTLRPYPDPWMPPINFVYLTDESNDPFYSNTYMDANGVIVPSTVGERRFGINTKWYVEGFGYIYLCADNGGELYSVKDMPEGKNLNYEFAKSRIARNRLVKTRYEKTGAIFSPEVEKMHALAQELFESAGKKINDGEKCGDLSNRSLNYALWAGEKIELEKAQYEIMMNKRTDHVYFGCETRQYIWARSEELTKRFLELFNFATITHYVWDSWYELFEPREGYYNWGVKDNIVNWLTENNITIEGRPLFWFHPTVTPDWLKNKTFDELKSYVEKHTRDLVSHYGDKVASWEVINEYHDWANIHGHTEKEITEIVRLACDKTKETNPNVKRLINNCCLWGEYAARGKAARQKEVANRPLRTARKFIADLIEEGVDFDIVGIQIYFLQRDLSDIVRMVESFEKFGKPIYITEIGASAGYMEGAIKLDQMDIEDVPYDWHRRWDEELQADWLEQVYTIYYSRPLIKAINWYDFSDFRPFIVNGGLVREDASTKRSFDRLKKLLGEWGRLPNKA
jgi:GH35 family endo-1,4-beta-xylanase